jgi:hypothetical protein
MLIMAYDGVITGGPDWQGVHVAQISSIQNAVQEYTGLPPAAATPLTSLSSPSPSSVTNSSSHITLSSPSDTKWLAVFQCGDFNIGPLNWRGGQADDWLAMKDYFQVSHLLLSACACACA